MEPWLQSGLPFSRAYRARDRARVLERFCRDKGPSPLPPVPMPYPFRYRRRELKGSPSGNLTLFLLLAACLWSGASSPVAGIGQPGLHMTMLLG